MAAQLRQKYLTLKTVATRLCVELASNHIFICTSGKIGNYTYVNGRTDEVGYGRVNAYEALKYTLENYGGTLSGEVTLTENLTINPETP